MMNRNEKMVSSIDSNQFYDVLAISGICNNFKFIRIDGMENNKITFDFSYHTFTNCHNIPTERIQRNYCTQTVRCSAVLSKIVH